MNRDPGKNLKLPKQFRTDPLAEVAWAGLLISIESNALSRRQAYELLKGSVATLRPLPEQLDESVDLVE